MSGAAAAVESERQQRDQHFSLVQQAYMVGVGLRRVWGTGWRSWLCVSRRERRVPPTLLPAQEAGVNVVLARSHPV